MAGFSDYLENATLNWIRGTAMPSAPASVYVALYTANPTDAGGGTELSGNGYTRKAATFGAPSGGTIATTGAVTFPDATADWGTITGVGIFDAATNGNLLAWGALTTNRTVLNGARLTFDTGALTVALD